MDKNTSMWLAFYFIVVGAVTFVLAFLEGSGAITFQLFPLATAVNVPVFDAKFLLFIILFLPYYVLQYVMALLCTFLVIDAPTSWIFMNWLPSFVCIGVGLWLAFKR
jgi:hypothetical protein